MKKINYILISIALVVIILGLVLMTGSTISDKYNPDVFSFRRITLAPIVTFIGFMLVIVGIMYKPKK